jgi:integrase/recombinase XerD
MGDVKLDIDFLKQMYNKFKETNEENIKIHVVANFLEMMGYDRAEFYYEHSMYHKDGRADIAAKIDDVTFLYVEVKTAGNNLSNKEQSQLAQYLHNRGLSWGILTNGKRFILFNDSITSPPNQDRDLMNDKVVFDIDLYNKRQNDKIIYFSKGNMFDYQITNYFRDIAQFKAIKYPDGGSSWKQYKGTLNRFFKYYANTQKRYRALEQIRIDEFEDFLKYVIESQNAKESKKKMKSSDTIESKYAHMRSFFNVLKVRSHGFDMEVNEFIKRMNFKEKESIDEEILSEKNIELLMDFCDETKGYNAVRDKVIFLLCLCFGLERSTLLKLTFNSIKSNKLIIGNRVLDLPDKILNLLNELKTEHEKNKIKINYLFCSKYESRYKQPNESTINYVFAKFEKIDKNNPLWKNLSPTYIRTYLIKHLFKNNYSIEEIVYLTGIELPNLSKSITYDEILEHVKHRNKKDIKVHPFHKFLY